MVAEASAICVGAVAGVCTRVRVGSPTGRLVGLGAIVLGCAARQAAMRAAPSSSNLDAESAPEQAPALQNSAKSLPQSNVVTAAGGQ
jgi:hypothetical protein